jgi:hypothetical protein
MSRPLASRAVTHEACEDCEGCEFSGRSRAVGQFEWCYLFAGLKVSESPCPDPAYRDAMLKAKRLKEGRCAPATS